VLAHHSKGPPFRWWVRLRVRDRVRVRFNSAIQNDRPKSVWVMEVPQMLSDIFAL